MLDARQDGLKASLSSTKHLTLHKGIPSTSVTQSHCSICLTVARRPCLQSINYHKSFIVALVLIICPPLKVFYDT